MSKFKVGDKVRVSAGCPAVIELIATVVRPAGDGLFDIQFSEGHRAFYHVANMELVESPPSPLDLLRRLVLAADADEPHILHDVIRAAREMVGRRES